MGVGVRRRLTACVARLFLAATVLARELDRGLLLLLLPPCPRPLTLSGRARWCSVP